MSLEVRYEVSAGLMGTICDDRLSEGPYLYKFHKDYIQYL
jgi:hypothetical protein